MMKTKPRYLILTLGLSLVLAACIMAAPDPCESKPDSAQCHLIQAQIELTLAAQQRTLAAAQTQEAHAAIVAAVAQTDHAHQTATATAAIPTATEAARQTATATAAIATATEAVRQTATTQAENATATHVARIEATQAALDALDMQAKVNQKNIEVALSGFLALAAGIMQLLLMVIVPPALVYGAYRLVKMIAPIVRHGLTVRAATVRTSPYRSARSTQWSDAPVDAPLLIFPRDDGTYDIIDPDRMIGAHVDSHGNGQPLTDADFAKNVEAWKLTRGTTTRDQWVALYQRSRAGGLEIQQIAAPREEPIEPDVIQGSYTVVSDQAEPVASWLSEVENRIALKAGKS